MEEHLRIHLITEMMRRAQEASALRRTAAKRNNELLERFAARRGSAGRSSRPPPIVEHSRASPSDPHPKSLATDRAIRGLTITGDEDDEKRRGPTAPGGGRSAPIPGQRPQPTVLGRSAPLQTRAAAIAAGYQPAVLKVVSYAHGAKRASATANYVDRDDAALETHDGRDLKGREAVNAEIGDWSKDFEARKESQDVAAVRLHVAGLKDVAADRALLEKAVASAFLGHNYAYRIDTLKSGAIEARAVVAFAGTLGKREEIDWKDGAPVRRVIEDRERFSVTERRVGDDEQGFVERVFAPKSEARMKARIEEQTGIGLHRITVEPGAPANGQSSVIHRLTRLTAEGPAITNRGERISGPSAVKETAGEWRRDLRSFKPRDTMHMIISAKASENVEDFTKAVRGFLHEQFADHKFMFGVHTDKEHAGHIHAHTIVAVKNAEGVKLHPGPSDFREWRQTFAEHAQSQGLKIVATTAAERASSQSYGPKDKAIVEAADNPRPGREARDRAYSNDPANNSLIDNARRRIETARSNPIRVPASERQLAVVNDAKNVWRELATHQPHNRFAAIVATRMEQSHVAGQVVLGLSNQAIIAQATRDTDMAVSAERMNDDLKVLNTAVDRVAALLSSESRTAFFERSNRYLENLAERVDLQRRAEATPAQQPSAAAQAVLKPVVEQAARVSSVEGQEADAARRMADRAVEFERRAEATSSPNPGDAREIETARAVARDAERSAAAERREAQAAAEAQRAITQNAAVPLAASLAVDARLEQLRRDQAEALRRIATERAHVEDRTKDRSAEQD